VRSRITARFCLVIYIIAAVGGLFDAGCCYEHTAHLAGTDTFHEHVHSRNQLAIHSFIHASLLMDQDVLTSPCCCCVYPGHDVVELSTYVVTNHRSWSDFSIRLGPTVLHAVNDVRTTTNGGMRVPPECLQTMHAFLSLDTIVLLI
jgi:hypothetical protein